MHYTAFCLHSNSRANVAAQINVVAKQVGPVAASRARASLSTFVRWAIGGGLAFSSHRKTNWK